MEILVQAAGVALVALALVDVFLIVLYLRGGVGLLTPLLSTLVWNLLKGVARLPRGRRDHLLSFAGPLILVAIAVAWLLMVWTGFALIVWPALGTGITASSGATSTDFATALYYAGYSLTTLGTGDLVPRTALWRLLMILEAGLGFALYTLVITYLLSVYSALRRRNVFATGLHHRTAATGSAGEYLVRLATGADPWRARGDFEVVVDGMVDLYESHQLYPILHYFRYPEAQYSIARIAFLALDTYSLMQASLDQEEHRPLLTSSATRGLWESTQQMLVGLGDTFLPDLDPDEGAASEERTIGWRDHLREVRTRLEEEGLALAPEAAAEERYVDLRRQWQPWVAAFAEHMGYPPEAVTGEERAEEDRWG